VKRRPTSRTCAALAFCLALTAAARAGGATAAEKPGGEAKPKSPYELFLEKGQVKDFPARPWDQAFVRDSECYRVTTNTSMDVAEYVGVLMDAIHLHYCQLFGVDRTRRAAINVFRTPEEMTGWATKTCRLSLKGGTIGFFTTWGGGTICVVWKKLSGQNPETVLMHEGTHQFVQAVWGTQTLPIWLNEGFAVYFENSRFDGRNLDVARVPPERLARLQGQMKTGKHVALEKLFTTEQKDFSVDHYGAAWAFVFWLAQSGDASRRSVHQQALGTFVGECRRGRKDGRQLVGCLGLTMEQAEKQWQEWVLKLDPKDPYGGLRKDAGQTAPPAPGGGK